MNRSFQVDLRGVVDLLSHHLYASPRVYLRELLQNAVDAITARRLTDPAAPARIWIEPATGSADGALRIHDTGVGLTEEQVHTLLATIGRSGKRDELGFARHDFMGQFGIGLLSCFMVADTIEVQTRSASGDTVMWVGSADGQYTVRAATAAEARREQGTTVTLRPRRDDEQWLGTALVTQLASEFGGFLPIAITVAGTATTRGALPWQESGPERRRRMLDYGRELLGSEPFDAIPLSVPAAGLTGVAYVMPTPVSPAGRSGHRVYLKRMLLGDSADGLLPDWAFFVRVVVDASELRPTASREALYEDALLDTVREALGEQVRQWLIRLASANPVRLGEFLDIHHLGVKAMAAHDDELLRLVEQWSPIETNVGPMTLAEFRDRYQVLRYVATVDQFRQIGAVAAAQDLPLINAGYSYDAELIERLPHLDNAIMVERLETTDLTTRFEAVPPEVELALQPFLLHAQRTLDRLGCEVVLRAFDPVSIPALFLVSRSAAFHEQLTDTRERVDDAWAGVLDAIAASGPADRPQFVLNHRNPLVRRVAALGETAVAELAVQGLYGQSLLLGHHRIRPADAALMNSSFLGLVDRAVAAEGA